MNIRLDGKRALVTGGNSGIGAAISTALADSGARVAINYIAHAEVAEQMAQTIRDQHGEAITVAADVSDPNSVSGMFQQLDKAWGGIDILINNAGIDGARAVGWEADLAAWRRVIDINLMGAFYCAREALQRMVPQKSGVILTTSSVH